MTPDQRRKAMQSNRGRTAPERKLASLLWRAGRRYVTADGYRRMAGVRLLGQPDLIFTRKKVVVFVDGCFWHGCRRCHDSAKNCNQFWRDKINGNVARDKRIALTLRKQGWKVVRVWEHDLRREADVAKTITKIERALDAACDAHEQSG